MLLTNFKGRGNLLLFWLAIHICLLTNRINLVQIISQLLTINMNVAVVGCLHGKLEFLYEELAEWEHKTGKAVDFILCCGDFQVSNVSLD